MVNRLTPSNIKRTANNLMDEWEKSLADPSMAQDKENSA
jgi:ribosomal protein S17E